MFTPRFIAFFTVWCAATVCLAPGCGQEPQTPVGKFDAPNVVLIIADTLRADVLGSYGADHSASRELDAYAKKGAVFDRVVASSSWTRPSTGGLLTGIYPRTLGLYEEQNQILPDEFDTLAEILSAAGYRTIGITANPTINSVFNFHQGFDQYVNSNVVFRWMEFEEKEEDYLQNTLPAAREVFDRALTLVREPADKPTYLQLNIMEMHEYKRGGQTLTRGEFSSLFRDKPEAIRLYLQALRQTSIDTARFLEKLFDLPGWQNTLVVFTSDHGEGLDDHPGIPYGAGHGQVLYESNVLVPWWMFHQGGDLEPKRVSQSVRSLDITPTIVEYLGLPLPGETDGRSLVPLLEAATSRVELPDYFVTETYFRNRDKSAAIGDDWNYLEHRDEHEGTDPRELQRAGMAANGSATNAIEAHSKIAEKMAAYLSEWYAAHPKSPPTPQKSDLSDDERDQLNSIGYLAGD